MNKFIKINISLFLLLFIYSCGFGEALQGKKRSEQGDEFLIDKKNPLVMPPDFNKLPTPGDSNLTSTKEIKNEESSIKDLLKNSEVTEDNMQSDQTNSLESLILKRIR